MTAMNTSDALKVLRDTAARTPKMEAFEELAKKLGVPRATVYSWWWSKRIPPWRLAAFDKLKKRRVA